MTQLLQHPSLLVHSPQPKGARARAQYRQPPGGQRHDRAHLLAWLYSAGHVSQARSKDQTVCPGPPLHRHLDWSVAQVGHPQRQRERAPPPGHPQRRAVPHFQLDLFEGQDPQQHPQTGEPGRILERANHHSQIMVAGFGAGIAWGSHGQFQCTSLTCRQIGLHIGLGSPRLVQPPLQMGTYGQQVAAVVEHAERQGNRLARFDLPAAFWQGRHQQAVWKVGNPAGGVLCGFDLPDLPVGEVERQPLNAGDGIQAIWVDGFWL